MNKTKSDRQMSPTTKKFHALQTAFDEVKTQLEQTQNNEKKIQAAIESVMEGIVIINSHGIIESFNTAAESIFGYRKQDVINQNVKILMPEPFHSNHDSYLQKYLETGKKNIIGFNREVLGKRKDGTTFFMEISATEVKTANGVFFVGMVRDITEKKQVEDKLKTTLAEINQSNENLLTLLDQLRIGVVMIDENGQVVFISKAYQSLMGKSISDYASTSWQDICPFDAKYKQELEGIFSSNNIIKNKIPVKISSLKDKHYCLEIEVHNDPRNSRAKILFVYDVTEVHDLQEQLNAEHHYYDLTGKNEKMRNIFRLIENISSVNSPVLIEGETGTGKELVARAVHRSSSRETGPFIAVNCAGLSPSLISSLLFGHKRGAFTGATEDHKGFFEAADHGTLFLDEIGDLPLELQSNLLRVIQEKEVTRVGETTPRKIDVRLLAATNKDLKAESDKGNFRSDLLYRLRVIFIQVPPLRERKDDIPILAEFLLRDFNVSLGKIVNNIDMSAMQVLLNYDWPGNVRELRNLLEASVINCKGNIIKIDDLPQDFHAPEKRISDLEIPAEYNIGKKQNSIRRILDALEQADGNKSEAARILGMGRTTLYRYMKKYNQKKHVNRKS